MRWSRHLENRTHLGLQRCKPQSSVKESNTEVPHKHGTTEDSLWGDNYSASAHISTVSTDGGSYARVYGRTGRSTCAAAIRDNSDRASTQNIHRLSSGCWRQEDNKPGIRNSWTHPRDTPIQYRHSPFSYLINTQHHEPQSIPTAPQNKYRWRPPVEEYPRVLSTTLLSVTKQKSLETSFLYPLPGSSAA